VLKKMQMSSSDPTDCVRGYVIGPAQFTNRLPLGLPLADFIALVWRKLVLSAHADTSAFGSFAAFSRPSLDQFTLKFRETAKDRQHEATGSRGGIGPLLSKRLK
jgi:hypothetical protein